MFKDARSAKRVLLLALYASLLMTFGGLSGCGQEPAFKDEMSQTTQAPNNASNQQAADSVAAQIDSSAAGSKSINAQGTGGAIPEGSGASGASGQLANSGDTKIVGSSQDSHESAVQSNDKGNANSDVAASEGPSADSGDADANEPVDNSEVLPDHKTLIKIIVEVGKTNLEVGESTSLSAKAIFAGPNGEQEPQDVTADAVWTSTPDGLLQVDLSRPEAKSIKALSPGEAHLTASFGGMSASVGIKIVACVSGKVLGVWLDPTASGQRTDNNYLGEFTSYSGQYNAVENYNYYSDSAHPRIGPKPVGFHNNVFFYETGGQLYFNFFSGVDTTGSPDNQVKLNIETANNSTLDKVMLSDDRGELNQVYRANGTAKYEGRFHYWHNTDGGIIGPFSGDQFVIKVSMIDSGDVHTAKFHSANGQTFILQQGDQISSFIIAFRENRTCN